MLKFLHENLFAELLLHGDVLVGILAISTSTGNIYK